MGQAGLPLPMSAADFLAWDATQTVKHEFLRGEIYAMTGATDAHVTTTMNVSMVLRQHLRGTPCRTFASDMKLRVEAADAFFYPEVFVTCSAADAADPQMKREPVLVVEVLSPSTAAYDRGDKFAAYRQLPSLRELLFIDPRRRRCDLHRLGADGLWVLHPFDPGAAVLLDSVGVTLPPEVLWEDVAETGPTADAGAAPAGVSAAP